MASPGVNSGDAPVRKGYIPEELQLQARKVESPVISELLVSARKGYTAEVLRLLQEDGAEKKASVVDKHGRTCLHLASLYGHFDTVLAILQTGLVNVNAASKRGLTPLHEAATEGHYKICLLLLAMGGYVGARTRDGWTPLMCASSNGHLQLTQILIAAGCDANTYTKIGLTALHIAAWKGHAGVVEMLVRVGCNPLAQTHNGKSALHLAQEEEQHECVTILQAATSKQSEEPMYRISTLEGQVRLGQDKLVQAHHKHDEILTNERSRNKEDITNLKHTHNSEMEEARKRINDLEEKVLGLEGSLEKALKQQAPADAKVDGSTPTNSPAKKKKHRTKEGKKSKVDARKLSVFSPTRTISPESLPKSASFSDLTALAKTERDGKEDTNRSLDTSISQRATTHEKHTITDMVAETLKNPSSIAVIRRELKADALTPRIERKFPMKTMPTTLPAVTGSTNETSPLARGLTKTSPKICKKNSTSSNGKLQ